MIANTSPSSQNLLADETSPYLLQHAGNPVRWYPWGEAAFAAARASGKPVLLSIGYSACHWCHVMAHESFEDQTTAALMNELFINIKVDREERPDLDRIYQVAHQLLTQRSGGWPLTMFLTHDDQVPFIGGTYFPPAERYGMPAFATILQRVADYYRLRQDELRGQSHALVETLTRLEQPQPHSAALTDAPLRALRLQLGTRFDREYGGWGPAPKFPHAGIIQFLLHAWRATAQETPDLQALFMATLTLKRMIDGGLYDHLGGGFARYSVDERWEVPHFEKMLYDNAALLSALSDATLATGDALFARAASETAQYLLRDCLLPGGAFCSSFDADSEGHEGRFYVWTREQVVAALGQEAAALFCAHYGLDGEPNFEGRWHLVARGDYEALSATDRQRLDQSRATLLALRNLRTWPGRDDKVLTSWNALAIHGLADAARVLERPDLAAAAAAALDYLRAYHWRDGRLLATSRAGVARLPAYLDDYAMLIDAILALATVQFRAADLAFAVQLADALLERFEDQANGGFFFTAHDHEALIHRSRVFADDAMPAGNAIAAQVLLKLGCLLGEPRYLLAAERTLRAAWGPLSEQPLGYVHLATALDTYLQLPIIVILRGQPEPLALWRAQLQRIYQPRAMIMAIPEAATGLPAALASKAAQGQIVGYVCRGTHCEAPATNIATLREALQGSA